MDRYFVVCVRLLSLFLRVSEVFRSPISASLGAGRCGMPLSLPSISHHLNRFHPLGPRHPDVQVSLVTERAVPFNETHRSSDLTRIALRCSWMMVDPAKGEQAYAIQTGCLSQRT